MQLVKNKAAAGVNSLEARRNRDTLDLLETLLAQTKAGVVTGIMVCASKGEAGYSMAVSGDYARNPMLALSAHSRVGHRLNLLADSQQADADAA